jgi:hypothetical protein
MTFRSKQLRTPEIYGAYSVISDMAASREVVSPRLLKAVPKAGTHIFPNVPKFDDSRNSRELVN